MKTPVRTKNSSIAYRLRSFSVVDAALYTQSGEAVAFLNSHYAPPTGGDGSADPAGTIVVDYQGVFTNLGTELRAAKDGMVAANTVHLGQLARIVDLQKQRTNLKQGLFDRFFKVRHGLESFFGSGQGFPMLAVDGETPRDPMGLVNQVRETVDFLGQPKVAQPTLDVDGVQFDLSAIATQLGGGADELEAVVDELERARKEAEVTRNAKNDAIDRYDSVFLWVGRTLESYFHLAGMHDLAERVRPSTRRPGRRAADETSEPDSGEETAEEATGEDAGEPVDTSDA